MKLTKKNSLFISICVQCFFFVNLYPQILMGFDHFGNESPNIEMFKTVNRTRLFL